MMRINKLFFNPSENLDLLPKFRTLETLSVSWQNDINRRLNGLYGTAFIEKR
ncbi:3-alpha domain-containing protein [Campylobacter rectus]|uniref:3-alpha domain-containing protein n=2 Tax=Campylobacter rectus TaxID=203 RepID=UPI001F37B91E|nr:3-alpha domain-containing protein [Campylobacter rectus]